MASKAIVIAGTASATGKTTVTLGLMAALKARGFRVQPFKAGPDYIDPGHHSAVLGRPSYNLDTWMCGADAVKRTFRRASAGADLSIIEGVMGLFDGKFTDKIGGGKFTGGRRSGEVSPEGSTAHLAKVLAKPVLLVVDAGRAATSAGAVVKGFSDFDPELRVKYVIFNRVGSDRHAAILEDSVRGLKGITFLGCVRRDERLEMPSRHLGLVINEEIERREWRAFVRAATRAVERGVDIDRLLRALRVKPGRAKADKAVKAPTPVSALKGVRIAVARDKAFSFYYQENLDRLEEAGARLVNFSPLRSNSLPRSIGGIYLGGGYPELHGRELAANSALMAEIREAAESGMPMLAECGGFIYLCRSLKSIEQRGKAGEVSAMTGLFPFKIEMTKRRTALGYREVLSTEAFPFLPAGQRVRGHEYRYSRIKGSMTGAERAFASEPTDKNGSGGSVNFDGYLYKQTVAGYTHLHFASNPAFAPGFVRACRSFVELREK